MQCDRQSWLIWQLLDSAFPLGGFAHSGGLEAAWQGGGLPSKTSLESWLRSNVEQQGRSMLPFVLATHRQPDRFTHWDAACHSTLPNPTANRASRLQGQALLSAAIRCFGCTELETLRQHLTHATQGHLAPMFGIVNRQLDIDESTSGPMYLFIQLRGWVSAAVRLNIIGPFEAQKVQASLAEICESTWIRCRTIPPDETAQSSPLLELWQAHHETLYSRLFQS